MMGSCNCTFPLSKVQERRVGDVVEDDDSNQLDDDNDNASEEDVGVMRLVGVVAA